jgi:hypothetical protein
MYQSEQFVHIFALREDWYEEDGWNPELAKTIKPGTTLGVFGSTLYELVEIHEFLARLARHNLYRDGVVVSIGLHNMKNRKLRNDDPNRMPLHWDYVTQAETIDFQEQYSAEQIANDSSDLALKVALHVFARFGWDRLSPEMLISARDTFLGRRQ